MAAGLVPTSEVCGTMSDMPSRLIDALSDRYRLERAGVEGWLTTHHIDDALALLRRRSPAVPPTVEETLRGWARSAERVVLVRGVLIDGTIRP